MVLLVLALQPGLFLMVLKKSVSPCIGGGGGGGSYNSTYRGGEGGGGGSFASGEFKESLKVNSYITAGVGHMVSLHQQAQTVVCFFWYCCNFFLTGTGISVFLLMVVNGGFYTQFGQGGNISKCIGLD